MLQDLKTQLGHSMNSVRRLLQSPVKLTPGGNLTLGVPQSSLRAQAREAERQCVRQIRRDLYRLLDQHPSSRLLVRHLATVEHTLATKGLAGFDALPVRVVAKALADLDSLVRDWSPVGLAELRSRMAVIVKMRPPGAEPVSTLVDQPSEWADITEVDHAEFEEMERSWVGVAPAGVQAAQRANA
ncbi:MAG: hypothetical protein ABUL50_12585 [Rhizobacter sp.]